jgi:hypothetical protein
LPKVNCNRYLPSKFVPKIRHVILIGIRAEGLSMKIKGESTSVKVLPWDPFATFNVAVLIHSFIHIECAVGTTILLFLYS